MYANVTTWQGERVNSVIFNDEESEIVIAFVGLRSDFIADFIDIFVNQRVLDDHATITNITHDRATNPGFIVCRKNSVSGAAHIRKFDVVRTSTTNKYDGGGDNGQQGSF
jgi:hypothetical protein